MSEHEKGQWRFCQDGECSCKKITLDHKPVATVACGEIGDRFPTIKLVEGTLGGVEGQITLKAEIQTFAMAEIPEEEAVARGRFIVRACNSFEALLAVCKELAEAIEEEHEDGDTYIVEHMMPLVKSARSVISKAEKP